MFMLGRFACVNNSLVLPMFVNLPALNYKATCQDKITFINDNSF